MTKKHFEDIARTIDYRRQQAAGNDAAETAVYHCAEALADTFIEFNPLFNRDQFLTACGFPLTSL